VLAVSLRSSASHRLPSAVAPTPAHAARLRRTFRRKRFSSKVSFPTKINFFNKILIFFTRHTPNLKFIASLFLCGENPPRLTSYYLPLTTKFHHQNASLIMKFLAKLTPAFVALFMAASPIFAQNVAVNINEPVAIQQVINKDFSDKAPAFRQWQPAYSVSQIEYKGDDMIVHFQFKKEAGDYVILYPIGDERAFVLRDKNGKVYQPKAIKNVTVGGQLLHADISKEAVSFAVESNSVLSCEITFPRLADGITKADLLEGVNYLEYSNHFHVFDVAIKTQKEVQEQIFVPQELVQTIVPILDIDESLVDIVEVPVNEEEIYFDDFNYEPTPYVSGRIAATELSSLVKEVKKPKYGKHAKTYSIDKIQYTEKEMVLTFTFHDGTYPSGTFYGPQGEQAWFLRDKNGNIYPVRAVNNLRQNDNTIIAEGISTAVIVSNEIQYGWNKYNKKGDRYSCEIVFDRLPQGVKVVDLIEGLGRETYSNHFNAFNIKVEQFKTPIVAEEPIIEPVTDPVAQPVVGQASDRSNLVIASSTNYNLFPNPNQGDFSITNKGQGQTKAMVQVLDLTGRIVFSTQANLQENGTNAFKVNNLVAGQYLVRITNNDKTSETIKMTVVE
jgi:hypothetical protein